MLIRAAYCKPAYVRAHSVLPWKFFCTSSWPSISLRKRFSVASVERVKPNNLRISLLSAFSDCTNNTTSYSIILTPQLQPPHRLRRHTSNTHPKTSQLPHPAAAATTTRILRRHARSFPLTNFQPPLPPKPASPPTLHRNTEPVPSLNHQALTKHLRQHLGFSTYSTATQIATTVPSTLRTSTMSGVELDPAELAFRRKLNNSTLLRSTARGKQLTIRHPGPFTREVNQTLRIKNPNHEPVAFKVRDSRAPPHPLPNQRRLI